MISFFFLHIVSAFSPHFQRFTKPLQPSTLQTFRIIHQYFPAHILFFFLNATILFSRLLQHDLSCTLSFFFIYYFQSNPILHICHVSGPKQLSGAALSFLFFLLSRHPRHPPRTRLSSRTFYPSASLGSPSSHRRICRTLRRTCPRL